MASLPLHLGLHSQAKGVDVCHHSVGQNFPLHGHMSLLLVVSSHEKK